MKSGDRFTAKIENVQVEGKIYISESDKRIAYLCQNSFDGASSDIKYGYKYSWGFYIQNPIGNSVSDLKVISSRKDRIDNLNL